MFKPRCSERRCAICQRFSYPIQALRPLLAILTETSHKQIYRTSLSLASHLRPCRVHSKRFVNCLRNLNWFWRFEDITGAKKQTNELGLGSCTGCRGHRSKNEAHGTLVLADPGLQVDSMMLWHCIRFHSHDLNPLSVKDCRKSRSLSGRPS